MKLYTSRRAPNPRRVDMFLAEKGVTHIERVVLDLNQGEHRSAAFLAKNPLARVPVLELDDGRLLSESRAICTYLESLFPEPNLMGASPQERAFYRALGVGIAEFPVTLETLDVSAAAGDFVVLGAPNVVRGGSHTGAVPAEPAIAAQKCAILVSDYYYPALFRAALLLDERGVLPLERAWGLVSSEPAAAAGLSDRGRIGPGLRADLVLVCGRAERPVATIAAGRAVYRTR